MTFLQFLERIIWDGFHYLDTSLDGQTIDLSDLRLTCLYLIGKEEFHDSLRRCTDVRSDTVTTANTDAEARELLRMMGAPFAQ